MDTVAAGGIVNMQCYGSGSEFFYPGFRVKKATDPRRKYDPDSGSCIRIFSPSRISDTDRGSRVKNSGSRIRIRIMICC
jgi:hypothetical protein